MMPEKQHVIFLTEGEIKALANMYRVANKLVGEDPYVEKLKTTGGKTAYDKLLDKVKEINGDANGE
jgi:uncharacterized protein YerC